MQVTLGIFLGHYYDQRSFLDTGYLVAIGQNPYITHNITVFPQNPLLSGANPIIGYPPLWPLLLGAIYQATYALNQNLFLYNFATKIPIIVANIALAYATKTFLEHLNADKKIVEFSFLFLLFNPFTLLTTAAWGEYDTVIALLCILALYFLSVGKTKTSSILLAFSAVLKPISLPLLALPLLFTKGNNRRKNILYLSIMAITVVALWFFPFYLLNWVPPDSPTLATSYFRMAGGMTLFNSVEIFTGTTNLPSFLDFLGYLWIPAVLIGYYAVYRNPPKNLTQLAEKATALLLIFFLTRTWLSEPNLNLIIAFLLITMACGKISKTTFHLSWIIALFFMFLNLAVPQLFFLVDPHIISSLTLCDAQFVTARLAARLAVTVLWYFVAAKILYDLLSKKTCTETS